MRVVRQVRKKESSLQLPATSLHLMQVSKFIEEYLHCQQKYMINLSAAAVHTHLPVRENNHQASFDIDLNVPYIESQHYDSRATFTDQHKDFEQHSHIDSHMKNIATSKSGTSKGNLENDDQNFTDREGSNSISSESEEVSCRQRKTILNEDEEQDEKFVQEDFKFVKHAKTCADISGSIVAGTQPNNSTKESRQLFIAERTYCLPMSEDVELQHLQETAYFLQERQRVQRRLMFQSQQQQNVPSMNQPNPPSKKAIFLSKIEKEKSRKQIAEAINRQRHHIKKFLK